MLRVGVFTTPKATYTMYELEEPGCYRIDFLSGTGVFNTSVDEVVYSLYRKRDTYTYGDRSVYDYYNKVRSTIESAQYDVVDKSSEWSNGQFFSFTKSVNAKLGYVIDCTQTNGVVTSINLTGCGCVIGLTTSAIVYGAAIEPINFADYVKATISKDTVKTEEVTGLFYNLDTLKRRYDLGYIENYNFCVAMTEEVFWERFNDFKNNPYPFRSFDTETTGTEVHMYGKDHMVGIVLGHDLNTATYFPFRHKGDFNLDMRFLDIIMEEVIRKQDVSTGHNTPFDRQVMLREGYDMRLKYDTLQLSIVNNPVTIGRVHGLKFLTDELMQRHTLELEEIFVNKKDIDFSVLPPDIIKYYACPDGVNSLIILENEMRKLKPKQFKLAQLECDLTHSIADQEYYGIRVDTKKYEHQYHNCNYVIDMLLKAFRTLTREDGNINSGPVMQNLIYNKMKCNVLTRTKTGQPSVAMPAIKKLAALKTKEPKKITTDLVDLDGKVIIKADALANAMYPALLILAKYREYNKLKTAFYARFERTMSTGRVFFWVNQNGAATGRQSSPMHQLPPDLKDCILADAPDRDFWGPDFSQIELRMIAYLAGETELIELAKDPNNDIHRIIGSLITGKEMWEITPAERSIGKRRNFGVVYLISKFGLAGQIYGPGYTAENVEFCDQQLKAFYKRFKRINRFINQNKIFVQEHGYMETAWFKRKRLFNEIFDPDIEPAKLASMLRMANNVPVQGTAADYLKLAIVIMDEYIRQKGWNKLMDDGFPMVRIMLSIHDELIISTHNEIPYEEIVEMITSCMETPVEGAPPFFVQPARMENWGGHSDDAVAMPIPFRDKIIADYNKTHVSIFKQSWFDLVIPEEVKVELDTGSLPNKAKVDKYWESVTLEFNHGDYVQEAESKTQRKEALMAYVESNKLSYRVDNYLDLLNGFRQDQLQGYMSDLISKYGMDYKVVGEHVRHPSLTFALLDNYDKRIPKELSHVESITEAVRLYIEEIKNGKITYVEPSAKVTEAESVNDMFVEQLEPLVSYDEYGNVVYENPEEENEDFTSFHAYYDESDDVIDIANNKPEYVWELGDAIVFDTQTFNKKTIDLILSYIYQHSTPTGFYRTYLIYNNQMLDTKMRVEELDLENINETLRQYAERSDYESTRSA